MTAAISYDDSHMYLPNGHMKGRLTEADIAEIREYADDDYYINSECASYAVGDIDLAMNHWKRLHSNSSTEIYRILALSIPDKATTHSIRVAIQNRTRKESIQRTSAG